jgi:flagellar motility protein MotE (MotC chaperone)
MNKKKKKKNWLENKKDFKEKLKNNSKNNSKIPKSIIPIKSKITPLKIFLIPPEKSINLLTLIPPPITMILKRTHTKNPILK